MTFTNSYDEDEIKVLRPTNQKYYSKDNYGFDIETYSDKNIFQCGSIYCYRTKEKFFFTDKLEMIDFFKTARFKNAFIYATNLGFDFLRTFEGEFEIAEFKMLMPNSSLMRAETYIINDAFSYWNPDKKKKCKLTFIDTGNYGMLPVEEMGKIIGILKMKCPFPYGYKCTKEELEVMKEYNMQDAIISVSYMEYIIKEFEDFGASVKLTIGSSAVSLYTNEFLKEEFYQTSMETMLLIKESYCGGRTEVFERGTIISKIINHDVNSMYPYGMTQLLPNPNPTSERHTTRNTLEYIKNYEGVSWVQIHCPYMKYPLLPKRENGKLLFPIGDWYGAYTHIELRYALELGYEIRFVNKTIYYTDCNYYLKDYALKMFERKNEYSKTKQTGKKHIAKLFLNALYGKFMEHHPKTSELIHIKNVTEDMCINNPDYEQVSKDYFRFTFINNDFPIHTIPIWATYITSYARIRLHEYMMKAVALGFNPLYVDTDSIFCEGLIEDSDELGMMKNEDTLREAIFVRPKYYFKDSINAFTQKEKIKNIKMKGISKKMVVDDKEVDISKENFISILLDDTHTVNYRRFTKRKESVRKGYNSGEIRASTKHLDIEDTKRYWKGKKFLLTERQTSEPIILGNSVEYPKEDNEIVTELGQHNIINTN